MDEGKTVFICEGPHCMSKGNNGEVQQAIKKTVSENCAGTRVSCAECLGRCKIGPNANIVEDNGQTQRLSNINNPNVVVDTIVEHSEV